jgi:hypothetical protein
VPRHIGEIPIRSSGVGLLLGSLGWQTRLARLRTISTAPKLKKNTLQSSKQPLAISCIWMDVYVSPIGTTFVIHSRLGLFIAQSLLASFLGLDTGTRL